MIGETETMKKMPDCEEKQGRRAVVKDISGCVAVASFAATSSQKQVMSLMSCFALLAETARSACVRARVRAIHRHFFQLFLFPNQ